MDRESSKELFEILVDNSKRVLRAGFGLNQVESTFFDIIELLQNNSSLKEDFLASARISMEARDPGVLDAGILPKELIELVAHEMRWTEIRSLAEMRLQSMFSGKRELAAGDIALSVMDAFDDDWPDREFYRRYDMSSTKVD